MYPQFCHTNLELNLGMQSMCDLENANVNKELPVT